MCRTLESEEERERERERERENMMMTALYYVERNIQGWLRGLRLAWNRFGSK